MFSLVLRASKNIFLKPRKSTRWNNYSREWLNNRTIIQYVDFFIKPFVAGLPSNIQDCTQVVKKIIRNSSCITATMGVESLYSKNVHDEGLDAWGASWRQAMMPSSDFIVKLTEWTNPMSSYSRPMHRNKMDCHGCIFCTKRCKSVFRIEGRMHQPISR